VTEKKVAQNYAISPNGETMARLTSFPLTGVQVISTATGKEIKTIPLDGQGAQPYLIGYGGSTDAVGLLWQRGGGGQSAVEVVNTKAVGSVTRITNFLIDNCDVSPSNPVISTDGQKLAVATMVGGEGGIDVYNLMDRDPKRRPRTLKIALPRWVPPAGMTWGPQGMLAAYFEIEGNGVLYHFQTTSPSVAPAHTHVFRGGRALIPQGGQAFVGRTLEFVSPNEWLVFGRQLIDVESGKSLGELGVSEPREQRVMDKDNLLIVSMAPNGTERLVHVELKPSEVLAKRNEVRGIKTPSK